MKNKIVAAILALFFGVLGVHRFYLGRKFWGIMHLMLFAATFTLTVNKVGPFIIAPAILGFIDAVLFFVMPQEDFDDKYNAKYLRKKQRRQEEWYSYYEEQEEEPRTKKSRKKQQRENMEALFNKIGFDKFRSGDFAGAADAFRDALEQSADSPMIHYHLACTFSMLHDAPSGFEHLEKAVDRGFSDFAKLEKHAALHYLRLQPEYAKFVANGYRRRPIPAESADTPTTHSSPSAESPTVVDELFQLGELMEKGLISEAEFSREKQRLLNQ